MIRSRCGGRRALERAAGAALLAALMLSVTACTEDASEPEPAAADPEDDASVENALGEPNAAAGTPVKVGLITNGAECPECGGAPADEEPVAQATVQWLNEYMNGLGGHQIELDVCVDDLDAAKTTDCANQLISDGVVAVVLASNGVIETAWNVLHGAGVPVVSIGATQADLVTDDASTFITNDAQANVADLPLSVAKDVGADKVSVIVINLGIATEIFEGDTPQTFEQEGVDLDVVPVDIGTADMTSQAQEIVRDNPDGVVMVVGHDEFCIPAIDGLTAVGFTGTIVTIGQCLTPATREAIPGDVLDGIVLASQAPLLDDEDPSVQQYRAVLQEFGATDVDPEDVIAHSVFVAFGAISVGTEALDGDVTPESVIASLRAMPNSLMPGSGGRHFQCDGNVAPGRPAICSSSLFAATLDADGLPVSYELINDTGDDGA